MSPRESGFYTNVGYIPWQLSCTRLSRPWSHDEWHASWLRRSSPLVQASRPAAEYKPPNNLRRELTRRPRHHPKLR
jgi:hypothetical protein